MGWAWNGHKVKRAMTLIVLGEGAGGYRRRVRAWLQHHNLLNEKDPNFFISYGSTFQNLITAYFPDPRTYGVSVGFKF